MDSYFNEFIVKRKKSPLEWAGLCFITIACIALILLVFFFGQRLMMLMPLLIIGICWGGYYLLTSLNIEYEYSVTNGDMDVDKIIAQRKRKRVLTCNAKDFLFFAPVSEQYAHAFQDSGLVKKYDVSSNAHPERAYFIIANLDGEKTRIVFEPTERIIEHFKRFVPRTTEFYEQ